MNKKQLTFFFITLGLLFFFIASPPKQASTRAIGGYYKDKAKLIGYLGSIIIIGSGLIYTFRDKK